LNKIEISDVHAAASTKLSAARRHNQAPRSTPPGGDDAPFIDVVTWENPQVAIEAAGPAHLSYSQGIRAQTGVAVVRSSKYGLRHARMTAVLARDPS